MTRYSKDERVEIQVALTAETPKALLVTTEIRGGQAVKAIWLPKSQIEYQKTGKKDQGFDILDIDLPQWIAEEKGLA